MSSWFPPAAKAPTLCTQVVDDEVGLRGWVVADTLFEGRAMGGMRMTPTVESEEVKGLARTMTYKLALAGMPIGGAKAGITSDLPRGEQRDRRLVRFGQCVAPLLQGGIYLGSDQGVAYRDRDLILQSAKYQVTLPSTQSFTWGEFWARSENITGQGCCEATLVAAEQLKLRPSQSTVAIQGFGIVGRGVARGLNAQGYRIVAIADSLGTLSSNDGLPIDQLIEATDVAGTIDRSRLPDWVRVTSEKDAWLDSSAEILVLAAVGNVVHRENCNRVRARLVVEGANFPCTNEALRALYQKGIPVIPDIVANSGGASVTALFLTRLVPDTLALDPVVQWCADDVLERIKANTRVLLEQVARDGSMLHEAAYKLATERLQSMVSALKGGHSVPSVAKLIRESLLRSPSPA